MRLTPCALRTKPAFGRGAGACALCCGSLGCRSLRGAPASSAARLRCRALRGSTLTSTDRAPPGSAYFPLQPGKRLLKFGEPLLDLTKKTLHLLQDIATGGGNAPTRRRLDAIHGAFDGRVDAACTTSCSGHVRWTSMLRRPLATSSLSMSMRAVPRSSRSLPTGTDEVNRVLSWSSFGMQDTEGRRRFAPISSPSRRWIGTTMHCTACPPHWHTQRTLPELW